MMVFLLPLTYCNHFFVSLKYIIARLNVLKNMNFLSYGQVLSHHTKIPFEILSGCPCLWNWLGIIYLPIKVHCGKGHCLPFQFHLSWFIYVFWTLNRTLDFLPSCLKKTKRNKTKLFSQPAVCFPSFAQRTLEYRFGGDLQHSCSLIFSSWNVDSCLISNWSGIFPLSFCVLDSYAL